MDHPFGDGCLWPKQPDEWRHWLEVNGKREREIWLLFPGRSTGLPHITYLQALEEALCFGWIDGMVRRRSEQFLSQRFSPRAKNSKWSEVNKQHARLLIANGKMTVEGMAILPNLDPNSYELPADLLEILRRDPIIWENFSTFPIYYRNIRLAAIDRCRGDPKLFEKTLNHFLEQTSKNCRYGRFR
jgi:uncharacterized protein YdeI (YjbR/CyaY-like superfamily)